MASVASYQAGDPAASVTSPGAVTATHTCTCPHMHVRSSGVNAGDPEGNTSLCGSLVLDFGATGSLSERVDSVPVMAQLWPPIGVTWGAFKAHCRGICPGQRAHSLAGGAIRCWRSSLGDSAVQPEKHLQGLWVPSLDSPQLPAISCKPCRLWKD